MRTVKTRNKYNRRKIQRFQRKMKKQYYVESKFDDQELQAMQRSPVRKKLSRNLFCVLTQQLLWENFDKKVH